ncbi:glycosyltransferase family 4 protein [Hydrogenophaga sp.]|uniref:glycosyltransferase family 4 protein n=1 Tax=Hydrogenophaga sp. TaxID=1904254 RepID=UPI0035B3076D
MRPRAPKLLFFVTVDWFFCSHFIERAKAARRAGYDVIVLTRVDRHRSVIEEAGLRLIPLAIDRRSLNPLEAFKTLVQLIYVFRRERPDVLHQIALKPILLGGLAARLTGIRRVVNAVVGGGYVFTSTSPLMRAIRPLMRLALKLLLNPPGSSVVFENRDDLSSFVRSHLVRAEDAVLIRGAGVDGDLYQPHPVSRTTPLVIVTARLLWDKGLGEFVAAARLLRAQGIQARFALVGDLDADNRASIDPAVLDEWKAEGVVELWGFRRDMPQVLAEADIVCLPSYREGLPKALLEAMAAGLPCVTTDVPGCREAVRDGENGWLVPPRDSKALAQALRLLIENPDLRNQMGQRGREMVLAEFASPIICRQTLQVYEKMLAL